MEKGTVLIVDDDPMVRGALAEILRTAGGYRAESAADGSEGIQKISHGDYDVVFTDLTMPGMNGIDFIRNAVRIKPHLPLIVITGFPSMENAVSAMKEGAKDFIAKPFSVKAVVSLADRVVNEHALVRKIAGAANGSLPFEKLKDELFCKLQELSVLQTIHSELDAITNNSELYDKIVEMASRLMMVQEVSFGVVENGRLTIKRAVGASPSVIELPGSSLERVVLQGRHRVFSPGEQDPYGSGTLTLSRLVVPFTVRQDVFGLLSMSHKLDGSAFTEEEISLALTFARKSAQRIENNALYEMFYHNLVATLKSLVISIEARDSYTKLHSERVSSYAVGIAKTMGLGEEDRDALQFGGYLHDIGKIGVRDTILLKPDRLTPEEMNEIKQHPLIGGNIIKPIRFFPNEREIILHHHERFDGSGYPDGLAGDQIPIAARILAVADTYDAMTSSRSYRSARSPEQAIAELKRCSDSQFDRNAVQAFLQSFPQGGTHDVPAR